MHKFDKIRRINKDEGASFKDDELVYVEEKIDGANFRVWIDEEKRIRFGSRTVEFKLENNELFDGYGAFQKAVDYIRNIGKGEFAEGYIYYFEAMIKHSLAYDFDKHPPAVLFDIYDIESDRYFERDILDNYSDKLEVVPLLFTGKYKDMLDTIPKSKYGNFEAEGFVIKPMHSSRDKHGNIHRAKVVGEKFKEEKREVWGDSTCKESAFAMRYATTGRIDKEIHKLETAKNEKVKPEWIPILTYNITKDICDEEFKKLLKMRSPNLMTIRSEVQRQVKLRLGQLMVI